MARADRYPGLVQKGTDIARVSAVEEKGHRAAALRCRPDDRHPRERAEQGIKLGKYGVLMRS